MFCLWVSYEEECLHLFPFYTRNTETEIWSGLITLKSKSELSIKTTSSVSQSFILSILKAGYHKFVTSKSDSFKEERLFPSRW